jgi:hypothetical protein
VELGSAQREYNLSKGFIRGEDKMRKTILLGICILVAMSLILSACAQPTPETIIQTQEVEKTMKYLSK